jgi:NitT/TauT family transport system ATP-binding protein
LAQTIVFVTHDVAEAVTLADRVLVMSKAPGRIQQEVRIHLPRPRKRDQEHLVPVIGELYAALNR